nr:thioredoxin domain-containing protein [Desulfobacteraceae bacterium]
MTTPALTSFSLSLPGAAPFDAGLAERLKQAKKSRGTGYLPRTRHPRSDGWAEYTNRLFLESSPYLLQHAHNPVNWYPWGDEAFETAARLKRPVFLSVGYATCHWCHVMEEESFEDEEIARCLNAHFVCVKVDREERPDIDAIYMNAVQALTGRGGWPMSVWLTPERKPFYGGTYFPAMDQGLNIGFLTLLERLRDIFHASDGRAENAARQITDAMQKMTATGPVGDLPEKQILDRAADFYRRYYDPVSGGMNGAPKFPSSLPIRFLLRYYQKTGDAGILEMAEHTLRQMARGGMYDQVAGGFHRYSTDDRWLVPHFEKMLYDNALLAVDYLEAFQITGDGQYKRIAVDILRYVERDMTAREGAFYSATDADSLTPDGRMAEGYYFTWMPEELGEVLGEERAGTVKAYYGVGPAPNFEDRHILHIHRSTAETARILGMPETRLMMEIETSRNLLYQARSRRPAPLRDEKILTAWNGLMISAFARAGLALGDSRHTGQAIRAARFILNHLCVDGRWRRSFKDGEARQSAFLEDIAFLTTALIDLFEATGDREWLGQAVFMDRILEQYYEDTESGGFFMTPS